MLAHEPVWATGRIASPEHSLGGACGDSRTPADSPDGMQILYGGSMKVSQRGRVVRPAGHRRWPGGASPGHEDFPVQSAG
ncbi:hypothetical protein DSL92_02325 [Billgrantia gudaonensis]|uniref:Uncharacterized protein n=1 Tax=Billgrantia gudaonensis TaxID=376427 RepID=A0A432JK55_9GAMM|nr:hypothetical protein DSL92_02325 [Halomonas gudaonensis]